MDFLLVVVSEVTCVMSFYRAAQSIAYSEVTGIIFFGVSARSIAYSEVTALGSFPEVAH